MKMDENWFWVLFWTVVVVGCTTDSALTNHYKVEYEKTKLEQMKYKFENKIEDTVGVVNIEKENK